MVCFLLQTLSNLRHPAFSDCRSTSHPSIISLEQYEDEHDANCHSLVTVTVAVVGPYDDPVWVIARDLFTEALLKCEVRLAEIHRLFVVTRQKSLEVGEEIALTAVAHDGEEN